MATRARQSWKTQHALIGLCDTRCINHNRRRVCMSTGDCISAPLQQNRERSRLARPKAPPQQQQHRERRRLARTKAPQQQQHRERGRLARTKSTTKSATRGARAARPHQSTTTAATLGARAARPLLVDLSHKPTTPVSASNAPTSAPPLLPRQAQVGDCGHFSTAIRINIQSATTHITRTDT